MLLQAPSWASVLQLPASYGRAAHVWVENFPPKDQVASIALAVAFGTLFLVLIQIGVAISELKAVKKDLDNNNKQMAEFLRRPRLFVTGSAEVMTTAESPLTIYNLKLSLHNDGDRPTSLSMLELLTPTRGSANHSHLSENDPNTRLVNGILYFVTALSNHGMLYPNSVPIVRVPDVRMDRSHSEPVQCLWRAYDEYAKFPADRYRAFNLGLTPTEYKLTMIDGPYDVMPLTIQRRGKSWWQFWKNDPTTPPS